MAEPNSADSPVEQSENESSNININMQSNGKNDIDLREELNSSNVNNNSNTKKKNFESNEIDIFGGINKPIGQNNSNIDINKLLEVLLLSGKQVTERLKYRGSPPSRPKVPTAASKRKLVVNKRPVSKKSNVKGKVLFKRPNRRIRRLKCSVKDFLELCSGGIGPLLLDVFDSLDIETWQARFSNDMSRTKSQSPPRKRRKPSRPKRVRSRTNTNTNTNTDTTLAGNAMPVVEAISAANTSATNLAATTTTTAPANTTPAVNTATTAATNPATPEVNLAANPAIPEVNLVANPTTPEVNLVANPATPEVNLAANPATPEVNLVANPATPEVNLAANPATPEVNLAANPATPEVNLAANPATPAVNLATNRSNDNTSPLSNNSQGSSGSAPARPVKKNGSPRSRRANADLKHPRFLLPFEYGWKREVVTRSVTPREDGVSKDVYYFHPSGKKLRSLREVNEKLTPGLTLENFTFYKEPIGVQYEIVRNARTSSNSQSPSNGSRATPVRRPRKRPAPVPIFPSGPGSNLPSPPVPSPGRSNSRASLDESGTFVVPPPAKRERVSSRCNRGTPRIALRGPVPASVNGGQAPLWPPIQRSEGPKPHPDAPDGPRRKITPRKRPLQPSQPGTSQQLVANAEEQNNEPLRNAVPATVTMPVPPTQAATESPEGEGQGQGQGEGEAEGEKTSGQKNENKDRRLDKKTTTQEGDQDYCTIRCINAMGLIPTLRCTICNSYYHPDCCDMGDITAVCASITYTCEKCQAKPPEFTERVLLKNIAPAGVTCDKSPPIISPKPIHPVVSSRVTPSAPLASKVPQLRPRPSSSGGFGWNPAWRPPTSTVFRSPSTQAPIIQRPDGSSSPPQSVINLNSKRYIIVPKRSVFSDTPPSPSESPTKAESVMTTTIITPTPTSTIIEGPPLINNPYIRMTGTGSGVFMFPFGTSRNPDADPNTQYPVFNPTAGSSAIQRSGQPDLPIGSGTLDHFARLRDRLSKRTTAAGVDRSMQRFMRNICLGYSALLHVFHYLKVQELLRCSRVCRLWNDLAAHSTLWTVVRMKNSQVSDWKGFTDALKRRSTKFLDLRKMLVASDDSEEMWSTFASHIADVPSLKGIEMCRCSARVIDKVIEACPQLIIFNAQMIGVKDQETNQEVKIDTVTKLKQLQEVRLKSSHGFNLVGSLECLINVAESLTVLSLTAVKNLSEVNVNHIGKLTNLEILELGECTNLPRNFPTAVIAKLQKIQRLRFEKGPSTCTLNEMLEEIKKLEDLVQLELVNFDITPGFDDALAACASLKRILIIPTYVSQSATTNHMILRGSFKLSKSVSDFVWVITMELLKVTELFVNQCKGKGSGGNGVPVLKPVPVLEGSTFRPTTQAEIRVEENIGGSRVSTSINVVPIDELRRMIKEALPNTKVKLLKLPFQNTWRHTLSEGSV